MEGFCSLVQRRVTANYEDTLCSLAYIVDSSRVAVEHDLHALLNDLREMSLIPTPISVAYGTYRYGTILIQVLRKALPQQRARNVRTVSSSKRIILERCAVQIALPQKPKRIVVSDTPRNVLAFIANIRSAILSNSCHDQLIPERVHLTPALVQNPAASKHGGWQGQQLAQQLEANPNSVTQNVTH